jgi:Fur family ferric uptake transcriptional regulator
MERDTPQRRAIRQAFRESDRPMSPQELLDAARGEVPRMGLATVYRTVRALEDEGWIVPVELPGEPQRYERAGKDHHHHFSCKSCRRTFELEGCPTGFEDMVPAGFRMDTHEVFLFGLCGECNVAGH